MDAEHLVQGLPHGLRHGPARQALGHRVHAGDAALRIGGDHAIADGVQRDGQAFLALAQFGLGFLAGQRKKIAAGTSKYSGRFWRMTNEIPFVLAIIMVLSVTMEWSF